MKCSAFIATSTDGYIATPDGGVDWLEAAGNPETGEGESFGSGGFEAYIASVDCMIMGRKCMEKIASFNLTPEQWPYGELPIFVLSNTLSAPPVNLKGKVEMYAGDIPKLLADLEARGYGHAYVDGGTTITSFIKQHLLNEITVTQAPVLLGEGLPLFGALTDSVKLSEAKATAFSNDFIQWHYRLNYSQE